MTRRARLAVLFAVLVAAVLWLTACAPPDAATSPGYASGEGAVTEWPVGQRPGPLELTGTGFDGATLDVADYRGEVLVVGTWYASCPPCRAEAPDLVALDAVDGVNLLGVNVRDDANTARQFRETFGVTYPSIDGVDGSAVAQMQGLVAARAVPTALILDPDGYVAARAVGRVEIATLRALVETASGGTVTFASADAEAAG